MVLTRTVLKLHDSAGSVKKLLSGPRQKFCEGIVAGKNATDAYISAYPESSVEGARRSGPRLLTKVDVLSEIARLRKAAESVPGHCVLTLAEKRDFLYRLVKARPSELEPNSDLWQSVKVTDMGTEYRLPDKLHAIKTDNDLAGEGSEAKGNEGLSALIRRIRR